MIYNTLHHPSNDLADCLLFSIGSVISYVGIQTKITISSSLPKNNQLKGQEKVIHICKLLNAQRYINAIGGVELYDKSSFKKHDIELLFLQTCWEKAIYKQFNNDFVSGLSIIDVLMFNPIERVRSYLTQFVLY